MVTTCSVIPPLTGNSFWMGLNLSIIYWQRCEISTCHWEIGMLIDFCHSGCVSGRSCESPGYDVAEDYALNFRQHRHFSTLPDRHAWSTVSWCLEGIQKVDLGNLGHTRSTVPWCLEGMQKMEWGHLGRISGYVLDSWPVRKHDDDTKEVHQNWVTMTTLIMALTCLIYIWQVLFVGVVSVTFSSGILIRHRYI